MLETFHTFCEFANKDSLYWFCAVAGSGIFVFQFVLNFLGSGNHDDIDPTASDVDAGRFKWLSKQAVTGFLMMFGWVGLTCKKEFELSGLLSALIGCAGGSVAVFVTAVIFKIAGKLRSPGTVFKIDDAIGKEATIYQCIPRGGRGKVSLSLHNFTHEIEAISTAQEDLLSFTTVQIIQKANETTVIVVPTR